MREKNPPIPSGHFQWNGGAWFGSLAGGTAYLLIGAVAIAQRNLLLAIVWAVCFIVALSAGIFLWRRRESMSAYPAHQSLILICGLSGAVAIGSAIWQAPRLLALVKLSPLGGLAMLLIFPALMLQFHLLEMKARHRSKSGS